MCATGSTLAFAPETGVFLGRQSELARLQEAMRKRQSLLIWGLPDSGKSTLVSRAISQMPERIVRRCIRATGNGSPQEILRSIAEGFADDPLFKSKFRADTGYGASSRTGSDNSQAFVFVACSIARPVQESIGSFWKIWRR